LIEIISQLISLLTCIFFNRQVLNPRYDTYLGFTLVFYGVTKIGGDRTNGLTTTVGAVADIFINSDQPSLECEKRTLDLWDRSIEMHSVKAVWLNNDR
jgi:hypothetical protein